jgi:hypothetical protein
MVNEKPRRQDPALSASGINLTFDLRIRRKTTILGRKAYATRTLLSFLDAARPGLGDVRETKAGRRPAPRCESTWIPGCFMTDKAPGGRRDTSQ